MSPVLLLIISLVAPIAGACKYGVQFTKPWIKWALNKAPAEVQASAIQVYAIVFGAVLLPLLAVALSHLTKVTFPVNYFNVGAAAAFGASAGLIAIGDYHAFDALRAIAAGLPALSFVASSPPEASAPAPSTAPESKPSA